MSDGAKVAVISGAASGIGAATVPELADAGFAVVGVDLAERPAELAGVEPLGWVRGDVTDEATWARVDAAAAEIDPGGASAFVACAADVTVDRFLDTPLEEWRRLYEINVLGVVRGMRRLLPPMVARGAGAVAITCSVNSVLVEEGISAYSATKAALLSASRTAALEHARDGIRINAVCPGIVDTPLLRKHIDSLDDPAAAERAMKQSIPTGELTQPREVATLLLYLVGDEASGLSGAALTIDGGVTTTYAFGAE